MGKGTDAAILDILFGHTAMQKNLLVAERQIDDATSAAARYYPRQPGAHAQQDLAEKAALGRCSAISSIGKAACSKAS